MKNELPVVQTGICDARLESGALEGVIRPGFSRNHTESFLSVTVKLQFEELEAVIAPRVGGMPNHNETFLTAVQPSRT